MNKEDHCDLAIELRGKPIRALAVVNKQSRLLRLEPHNAPRFMPTQEQVQKYVFENWDGLLRKLAE